MINWLQTHVFHRCLYAKLVNAVLEMVMSDTVDRVSTNGLQSAREVT